MTAKDLPDQKFDYIGPERVAVNFWHVTRNIMAREKALYEGHAIAAVAAISASIAEEAAALIKVDYEVLPHVIDVDEAMAARRAAAVRGHDHPRRRAGADQALQHLQAAGIRDRRHRGRLRAGRRRDREGVQDRRGAPGLYRAARLRGALRRRRPDRDLVLEPGPLPDARADRADPRQKPIGDIRVYSGGDRRRLRRQDGDLSGAGRDAAVEEVRPAGAADDEPRGRVPGHRPDLGFVDVGEDRRHEGRQDRRRRRHLQVPGRRVPRLAGDERLPVRVRAVRHPEPARGRLRRGVQPAEVGGVSRAGLADLRLRGRERDRHVRQGDRHGSAGTAHQERRQHRHADHLRAEACA